MKGFVVRFFLVVAILLTGGFLFFYYLSLSNSTISEDVKHKALRETLGREVKTTNTVVTGNGRYTGMYIAFSYPKAAKPYIYGMEETKKLQSILENFQFSEDKPKYFFTVSVEKGTDIHNLGDISGVSFRRNTQADYKEESATIAGAPAVVFTKSGQEGEKTAFVLQYGKVYLFSVTGSDSQKIAEVFRVVTQSTVFK